MSHVVKYFSELNEISQLVDCDSIEKLVTALKALREREGRLFVLGVGGSAANAQHAVNDFRKLCHIEAYAPTDNISEITARTNDNGWESVFSEWLMVSQLRKQDALFILSVGGGNVEANVSVNLIQAINVALDRGSSVFGIVGRDGGYTAKVGHEVIKVPVLNESRITPHTEAFQAIIWHCIVSHPSLQCAATKW
jgi:D-sedoheptulose 7-phosphate isomerase